MNRYDVVAAVSAVLVAITLFFGANINLIADVEPEKPADIEYEDPNETDKIEEALISAATYVGECRVTYYCNEPYPHICGNGDGLTAMGTHIIPGVSVAVDPKVIPLGSTVYVDYGDGILWEYLAQDVGGMVNDLHIDVAVESHDKAMALGVDTAKVWYKEGC